MVIAMKIKRMILVNAKRVFTDNFLPTLKDTSLPYVQCTIDDMAFACFRDQSESHLYIDGQRFRPEDGDYFYISRSEPNGSGVAVLSMLLKGIQTRFSDARMNVSHSVRSSKTSQSFVLKPEGIRFPDTWVMTPSSYEKHRSLVIDTLNFPLVMKIKGSQGKNVWKCDNEAALDERVTSVRLHQKPKLILFQELVENDFDIRVIVFQGEVLAAIKRSSHDGFHNNVSQGGSAKSIDISNEESDISVRAAQTLGLDLAGVDIVRTEHGPLLFEVNKSPDLSIFNDAAGFNIPAKIASLLGERGVRD